MSNYPRPTRERRKLVRKKLINELEIKGKMEEFQISLQNRYTAITEDEVLGVQAINDNLNSIISECAVEMGARATRQNTSKLSQETKDLIKKLQNMKVSNTVSKIELAELSKLINKRKINDRRKHNVQTIDHALIKGGSIKAVKRKLGLGKNEIYGMIDK